MKQQDSVVGEPARNSPSNVDNDTGTEGIVAVIASAIMTGGIWCFDVMRPDVMCRVFVRFVCRVVHVW